jgi:hypothetical protein
VIGCNPNYAPEVFTGKIDEVRVYDRALSEGEVGADKAAPIQTPQQGPVAAYSFDEGEGSTVEDLTGNGHTGTIHGAKWTTRGRYGDALEYYAPEEDYVSIPASEGLDGSEELTVEAWVRPTVTDPYYGEIVMKEREETGPSYSWTLDRHETEPAGFFMRTEEGMVAGGKGSLPLHTWTHVAMTDDGAHNRLYVNGELVDTEPAIPFDGHGEIRIGGNGVFGQYFYGRIDEVRIYERALSGGELQVDKAAAIQTPQQGPVAAYSFDEGEGGTAEDLTGNGHTGTIEGPEWTDRGKYGKALSFDGENDCVTVPESSELDLGEEFTLESWVKPEGELKHDPIVFKEGEGFPSYALGIGIPHSGKAEGVIGQEGKGHENIYSSESVQAKVWSHLALTYDGAKLRLYVNGELVADETVENPDSGSPGPLTIGCDELYGTYFKGKIDEVRVYNRALDASEVATDKAAAIQTPQQGPIAAYSFDAGEGETVEDVTGNEHDGTIEGPEWTDRGKYGDALAFNGEAEDCVTVPESEELELSEEMTLEAWVKAGSPTEDDPIIFKEGYGGIGYAMGLGVSSAGKPDGLIGEGGGEFESVTAPYAIEANVWTHLAFTYDGAHMRLYVNGELVATKTQSSGPLAAGGSLRIGCSGIWEEGFDGRIDEVRIYDRALGAAEVAPDTRPPTQPTGLDAMFEEEEVDDTFVTWNPSTDPAESNGRAGSGLNAYRYRYRLESGPWSQWQATSMASFGIPSTVENEAVGVEVVAEDNEGNSSPLRYAQLISRPPTLTDAEPGQEEPNEIGPDDIGPEPVHTNPAENEESGSSEAFVLLSGDELCSEEENPCGKYDWKGAMEYAERWTLWGKNSTQVDEHHNHDFLYLGGNGGDCTNFASQVLWGGNMQFMRTRGHDSPDIDANGENNFGDYRYGQGSWWSGYSYDFGQPPKLFRTPTESWDNAHRLFEHLVEYGLAEPLGGQPVRAGDLIFYDLYHGQDIEHIDHTQVVERVTHHTIWIAQHSPAFLRTLKHEKTHVRQEYGIRGVDWEMWIMRPTHTKANL